MSRRYCYWTVASGGYASMARQLVASARQAGVSEDFHIWADVEIEGAIGHPLGLSEITGRHFKFTYLREYVQKLDYDYFVWLDADTFFARNPGDPLQFMQRSPLHVPLESNLSHSEMQNDSWCGCRNSRLVELMRERGVRGRNVYGAGGGMFIIHHEFVETLLALTKSFYSFCKERGHSLGFAPLLSYAMQMVCGDPDRHLLTKNTDLWCSDSQGVFRDRLPDGTIWEYRDPLSREVTLVNPAIVHIGLSKSLLTENDGLQNRADRSTD